MLALISIRTNYLSHWTSCWLHSLPSDANERPVSNLWHLVTYKKARTTGDINRTKAPINAEGNESFICPARWHPSGAWQFSNNYLLWGQANLTNWSYFLSGQVIKCIPKHLIWFKPLRTYTSSSFFLYYVSVCGRHSCVCAKHSVTVLCVCVFTPWRNIWMAMEGNGFPLLSINSANCIWNIRQLLGRR